MYIQAPLRRFGFYDSGRPQNMLEAAATMNRTTIGGPARVLNLRSKIMAEDKTMFVQSKYLVDVFLSKVTCDWFMP